MFVRNLVIAALATLSLAACKKDSPTDPGAGGSPMAGKWHVISVGANNATSLGGSWEFSGNQSTYKQQLTGCTTTFSFTSTSDELILTSKVDGCVGTSAGSVDTLSYTISGDQMTLDADGTTMILKKGTAAAVPTLAGKWNLTTVDGSGPNPGVSVVFNFAATTFTQTTTRADVGTCSTTYEYGWGGETLGITVIEETCDNIPVGTEDNMRYSFSADGKTLTLTSVDGTVLVAQRAG